MSYEQIGHLYDSLQDEQQYQQWYRLIRHFKPQNDEIIWCDIACGTGLMLANLPEITHKIGIDLSSDMLMQAQQKNPTVSFMQQNMAEFNLGHQVDYITILCDSLNYLLTIEEVTATFKAVYQHLTTGGVFLFDVHTLNQIKQFARDEVYQYDDGEVSYIWYCDEVDNGKIIHDLIFYQQYANDLYQRIEEQHIEQTYDTATYIDLLEKVGFTINHVFYDFDINQQQETNAARLFIVCQKD